MNCLEKLFLQKTTPIRSTPFKRDVQLHQLEVLIAANDQSSLSSGIVNLGRQRLNEITSCTHRPVDGGTDEKTVRFA